MTPKHPCLLVPWFLHDPFYVRVGRNSDFLLTNKVWLWWWNVISAIMLHHTVTHPARRRSCSLAGFEEASGLWVCCEMPYGEAICQETESSCWPTANQKKQALSPIGHEVVNSANNRINLEVNPSSVKPWDEIAAQVNTLIAALGDLRQRSQLSQAQVPNPMKPG